MTQTKRGYDLFELLSALQKDIRRGNEYEAMFWAAELETFNPTALWNRLAVIASEDIGPANPMMPLVIETLERQYLEARERRNDDCMLFLANAVSSLVRSQKSRVADDLLVVVYAEVQYEDKRLAIPDYALDKHTLRGKRMGRGWEHFYTKGNILSNEAFDNPHIARAKHLMMKYDSLKPYFFQEEPVESKPSQRVSDKESVSSASEQQTSGGS